ncbi:enoyl-CoA hydratase-related protein [Neptunomonas japonica]|uniref:enoyl-CoA hydratase-related protein n=1 Tax=Neptunomonas japonica TaxID=417574 RepID=UPI000416452D|nr:enoyl-CoA hydratase-related protein [Neptunomonas japonica]
MSKVEHVLQQQDGAVLVLQINRPDKKNALTLDMYQALIDGLLLAAEDDVIRCVLISGSADCFTSGNDILDFMAASVGSDKAALPLKFLQTISTFSKPVIAAVAGDAVGIGTSMLLHCDLVYCTKDARFQLPFARLGLVPEGGTSLLLPQQLGHRLAFELLVLGSRVSGVRAAELGLVNSALDHPLSEAKAAAAQLANMAPQAVKLSKNMMKSHQQATLQTVLVDEVEQFKERLASAEAKEAFSAFIEKRQPNFS